MSSKFTCRFCKETFDDPKGLYKHLQSAHNTGASRDNRTCPICGVLCSKYEGYRDHLLYIHGQAEEGQKLTFKSLNEFLIWKAELEMKHSCKYVLQSAPKVLPNKEKKYFYQCDRSKSQKRDKKSLSVVMKTCPSVISVMEGTGVFQVEYWDNHTGHSTNTEPPPMRYEIEAALSSMDMVKAISDSGDSFDRSEDLMSENSSDAVANADKQSFSSKTNVTPNVNKSSVKASHLSNSQSSVKKSSQCCPKVVSSKKKNINTSMLFSLASVACGKGISKKNTTNKTDENKESDTSKNSCEKPIESSTEVQKDDSPSIACEAVTENQTSKGSLTTTATAITPSPSSATVTKTMKSGLQPIAPKTSKVSNNSINSLITPNNAFSNQQLVIVNPIGVNQNTVGSTKNVFAAGQNILVSLTPVAPSITPQTINAVPIVGNKSTAATADTKGIDAETSIKIYSSDASSVTAKAPIKNSSSDPLPAAAKSSIKINSSKAAPTTTKTTSLLPQIVPKSSSSIVASTASTVTPFTLAAGMSNAPVILSSFPVGSTFMSVNNSLIPVATPSGAFLPTTLPPNIVLTPVVPGSTMSSVESSLKTTVSGTVLAKTTASSVSAPLANVQAQMRYSTPSTVAITVSSIVKEPVYTSSAIKHMSNIVTSVALPVPSSTPPVKSYSKNQFRSAPVSLPNQFSALKTANKVMTSTPLKPKGIVESSSTISSSSRIRNTLAESIISNKSMPSATSSVTVSSASTPKIPGSARKQMNKRAAGTKASASTGTIPADKSVVDTKVVNTLHRAPISSAIVASQQKNLQQNNTFLFQSSGEVYMLEPVENVDDSINTSRSLLKSRSGFPNIKIDRSVQTAETSNISSLRARLKRKLSSSSSGEDSAVMLKVKCYQLEMKYLNVQAECKRLKVELTKEKLKNAELSGDKTAVNVEKDSSMDNVRNTASEIMKEIEEKFSEKTDADVYTMTKTSVLRSLYEDLEGVCSDNKVMRKELERYRKHDRFYKYLKRKLQDEEF